MASEKIDALELDINAKLTTENLDKLITALGKLSKALDNVNAKKVKDEIKDTGDASKEAAAKADLLTNSFVNQAVKITALVAVYRKLADVISTGLENSMSYVENMNLFTVSLGQYSENASKYADTVRDALGIDPSGWIRTQGVFNTLIEGFGVGAEQAAYMSQNLTQLTYDIASFYNLSISDAEKKIQSAVAGELEPVRRLGYDLSQNALTAIAQNPKYYGETTYSVNELTGALEANSTALEDNTVRTIANFNELTQGEKVQLRYIALMTQVQEAQGDMQRSLYDPANQIRIFREQLTMTSRALGNVFIPALNEVMPYLIAFFRVVEEGLQRLAAWAGFELPDMSDRMSVSDDVPYYENIVDSTGRAAKNAKKMKDYMIGIDELNVLRPDDGTTSGGGGGSDNPYALGSIFKTPGYDFLSSSIENRIKDIKEAFDELGKDFEEHPLQVTGKILWEGFGTIGEGFWTWVLGKTPEELAEEAWANGNTIGEQLALAFLESAQNTSFGEASEGVIEWLVGKSSSELAQDAWDSGKTVKQAFVGALLTNTATSSFGRGFSIIEQMLGFDSNLETRAQSAGRTVGEQFVLEINKAFASLATQNPFFEWLYEVSTGRSAKADLEAYQRAIYGWKPTDDPYKVREVLGIDGAMPGTNNSQVYQRDNAATIEAAKHGKTVAEAYAQGAQKTYKATDNAAVIEAQKHAAAVAKAYADGLKKNWDNAEEVANDFYNVVYGGVTNQGKGVESFYKTSSNMSKRYADGLVNGVSGAANAGKSLYNSGYNGATNYGKALADYYNVSSGASKEYAKGLVNGTTSVASAGQTLYVYGYNGVADYGNGGKEYSNLADNFANLFAGALSSNSALSGSYNSGYKLANEGTWGAYDLNGEYDYVGTMAGQGYILGIQKSKYEAENSGYIVANSTLQKMREVLGIASPSKEAYAVGKFFDEGFANAISDFTSLATDNASNMAELSLKAMRTTNGMFSNFSVPTNNNAGYGVGAMNESAMMNMASTIYQAVASGISTISLNGDDRDIKVIIDGKEVFTSVETERRRRGVGVGNNAFGGV